MIDVVRVVYNDTMEPRQILVHQLMRSSAEVHDGSSPARIAAHENLETFHFDDFRIGPDVIANSTFLIKVRMRLIRLLLISARFALRRIRFFADL
jgi:hypothetical protein